MANGNRVVRLRLPGFILPSNVVMYFSCHNAASEELTKVFWQFSICFVSWSAVVQSFSALLQCCFSLAPVMRRSREKLAIRIGNKHTYGKMNGGLMKIPKLNLTGYEKTTDGPLKSLCSTLIGCEKTLTGPLAGTLENTLAGLLRVAGPYNYSQYWLRYQTFEVFSLVEV